MNTVACFLVTWLSITNLYAQTKPLPIIKTKTNRLTMYVDGQKNNFNGINDIPDSFSYDFGLAKETVPFSLVSEYDSVAMTLQNGVNTDFLIVREAKGDTVTCHFTSHKVVKAATFTDAYKKANEGKTLIEIPEVYELINVIFALTDYGKTPAIHKATDYYSAVLTHFAPYRNLPAVRVIDSLLRKSADEYAPLKMDSYAYRFQGGKLVKSDIYDRASWRETNAFAPYVLLVEDFARQSKFSSFYQEHTAYYTTLIRDFRQNIDVATMKSWLEKQFPTTRYSAVKIIFSPLVGYNQSASSFSDNGFTEAQAHIDFPFTDGEQKKQPPSITRGQRMRIAFTELNHSYLNPEAEKYTKLVDSTFADLSKWSTHNTPATNYNNPLLCFEEYMNHALTTLFYRDLFDTKTYELLRAANEKGMTTKRGFRKFREFDQELVRLYSTRKPGQTVADLYPAILAWAAKQ